MKDVILTTDLYHQHADPNDHWNLATMFSLAKAKYINFVGIMCDDDRALASDGSYLHFGDPAVMSVAQLSYLTGVTVPVGFGSREPIRSEDDIKRVLSSDKPISSVNLLLKALRETKNGVDIHMCGSCKDVLLAYRADPDAFIHGCDTIYLNAGTYLKNEPIEYNVSLEPYAYSEIFKIPVKICWSPCFDELRPWPYKPSKRATFYELNESEVTKSLSSELLKYFSFMYGKIESSAWLSYLKAPLDLKLYESWREQRREMWSTPGYLTSAGKNVSLDGEIIDAGEGKELFAYTPVSVNVTRDGKITWQDVEKSNVYMFESHDPQLYFELMPRAVTEILSWL